MSYEEKYKEVLERAEKIYHSEFKPDEAAVLAEYLPVIFPELKESEDEKIRKTLIEYIKGIKSWNYFLGISKEQMIAWLEKQDNKSVNIDVESMVSSYEQRLESQGGTKYTPLVNMRLTAFRHGVENVLEELNLKKLEKQGEQMTKPKFKVGDWCIDNEDGVIFQIVKVLDNTYTYKTNEGKEYSCTHYSLENDAKLWTIQDAKDGDVLVCEDENFTIPFIAIYKCLGDTVYNYKGLKDLTFNSHCFMGFNGNFYEGEGGHVIEGIHPGTKEQRNLLFQKMKEAGYEWDAQKKEVKKIEVASKESEDEQMIERLKSCVYASDITPEGREEIFTWLEKQGNNKKLDANKVIEWLEPLHHGYIVDGIINKFKEDFGL